MKEKPRDLCRVINAVVAIAPELRPKFVPIYERVFFVAPELQQPYYRQAAEVLAEWWGGYTPETVPEVVRRVGRLWSAVDELPPVAHGEQPPTPAQFEGVS